MPNPIKPKRSYTSGKSPRASEIAQDELAINWADGRLFTKNSAGQVVSMAIDGGRTGPPGPPGTFGTPQDINAQGSNYTLVLADAGKLVTNNSGTAVTITVPLNSAVAFPVGTHIDIARLGAGAVTIDGDSGVTVNATPGRKLRATYSTGTLIKLGTNTWLLVGDLAS